MLEELQTLALVGLLVSTYYLTVGCRKISEGIPEESEAISSKVALATEVLDDIANLLNEALASLSSAPIAQTASSPVEMILSSLMTRMTSPPEHGPQPEEWEILENDSTTPPTQ
jgi:hypothetical protein